MISTKQWDEAIHRLNMVKLRYKTLEKHTGKPTSSIIILELEELQLRLNTGEKSEELYKELMSVK